MKRLFIILAGVLLIGTPSIHAQQANRDKLTMEEAVLGTGVSIQNIRWHWTGDRNVFAIDTEKATPRRTQSRPEKFAYTKSNNLYYKGKDGVEHAITSFTDPNIVCGQSVSRNEFGIEGGIFVAPDSSKIAFYCKDESKVTEFPLLDINTRTGSLEKIKYPMNGMASEKVSLGVYDIASGRTVWMAVSDFDDDRYLTNITWNPECDKIYIQVIDRAQKHVHLNVYNAADGAFIRTILTEENSRFVEPQWPLHFLPGDPTKFIYTTDNRDGFKNLYLCNIKGAFDDMDKPVEVRRLTKVDADVEFDSTDGRYLYYYSAEVSPTERHLFRLDMKKGQTVRLTREHGWHRCTFSPDGKYIMDQYSSIDVPLAYCLASTDGKTFREVYRAEAPALLSNCRIETGTVKSADGKYDNHYSLVYPLGFDPAKKYPVILYVYGGPHLQQIKDTFLGGLSRWDVYMAQRGYIVFTMDNRGTPNRGAEYEKAIHKHCGKAEMEDQMEGVKWLMSHDWVDKDRIGVHGWSYGGFMTISLTVNYPDVFKVAVAGGPVIDWKWYEIMYGERYMETPATNAEGFESTSLIPRAKDLKGKLLICQGAVDKTVVWEHSLSFIEACIKNNVQVDYFPYPTHEHNVLGRDRIHLMDKVTNYFEDYLK